MSNDHSVFITGISRRNSEQESFKFTVSHGIWLFFVIIEVMVAVRIGLLLIGADPKNQFVALIYSLTHLLLFPFAGIMGSPIAGRMLFELSSVFAMAIYVLLGGIVEKVVWLLLYNPVEPVIGNRGTTFIEISRNDDDTVTQ